MARPGDIVTRRAGSYVPAYIVQRLQRFHPTVRMRWDPKDSCWMLVDKSYFGSYHLIRKLKKFRGGAEKPTLKNTVLWLNEHDARRHANQYELARWLGEVDAAGPHDEIKASEDAASDKIAEGTDRIWRATGKRIPFSVKPSACGGPSGSPGDA